MDSSNMDTTYAPALWKGICIRLNLLNILLVEPNSMIHKLGSKYIDRKSQELAMTGARNSKEHRAKSINFVQPLIHPLSTLRETSLI